MRIPPGESRVAQEMDHGHADQMIGTAIGGERYGNVRLLQIGRK